ncbi:MAG: penicillin-binding protein activator LpoB [Balneolaceae bacterium]
MKQILITTLIFTFAFIGCRPSQNITRIDPGTQTDLSGRWNDTDARLVAQEMIPDALSKPWLGQFQTLHEKPPVIIVGNVRNESMEHIDTEVFTKEVERAFVNSGTISIVASRDEREQVRDERIDQQRWASEESTRELARELGADYMMIGNINQIVDEAVDQRTLAVFYTVNLELINIETNQKVWIGNKKIKKFIERRNFRG